jgi:hypothetical protein
MPFDARYMFSTMGNATVTILGVVSKVYVVYQRIRGVGGDAKRPKRCRMGGFRLVLIRLWDWLNLAKILREIRPSIGVWRDAE